MSEHDGRLEELREKLRLLGLRLTPQRLAVWRLFAASATGYTLPEACRALRRAAADDRRHLGPGIGQATVYRLVKSFEELGFLRYVHDADGEHRYLAAGPGHCHYLACRSCGRTCQVTHCDLSTLEKLLAMQTGYSVEGHHLEFYGTCPACQQAQQNS